MEDKNLQMRKENTTEIAIEVHVLFTHQCEQPLHEGCKERRHQARRKREVESGSLVKRNHMRALKYKHHIWQLVVLILW